MVNNVINVSAYRGEPPQSGSDRKISGGPLYSRADVEAALQNGEPAIVAWTRKCINDLQSLSLDASDLITLIKTAIDQGVFKGSEWCEQKPSGPWAACDAYRLLRREWVEGMNKEVDMSYYIKFAIGKTGALLLIVSCHL